MGVDLKYILAFALAFMIFVTPVFAKTYYYCMDNTTLRKISEVKIDVPERNTTRTINVTEDIQCQFGCQNDRCLDSPAKNWGIAIGIIFGVFFLIWIIWAMFR